ncbi:putative glycolipid-binding domain-containing protein [Phytomonospora sp. NPDC050363]|uniref:putative glycolipid-binding domain-containing protein n=1 Tax=Phytomonospora sp. NPDC050363 TaxID=3155642 RepID=UPI0033E98724
MTRTRIWVKPEGAEFVAAELGRDRLSASGTAVGADPMPYRLTYELATTGRWVTSRLVVETSGADPATGPWRRRLELGNRDGEWTAAVEAEGTPDLPPPGGDVAALSGALDCDLGLSPLTNTMPVLRAGLLDGGGPVEFLMAWVSVPDLAVVPSRQTYTFVSGGADHSVVRYASPGFTREVVFDPDGLVRDYPGIGRAVG